MKLTNLGRRSASEGYNFESGTTFTQFGTVVVLGVTQTLDIEQVYLWVAHRERSPMPSSPVQYERVVRTQEESAYMVQVLGALQLR